MRIADVQRAQRRQSSDVLTDTSASRTG
jgi:hypothetical protein